MPYYISYRVFSMQPSELEEVGSAMGVARLPNNEFSKKELIERLCEELGITQELDYSSKRMRQALVDIANPLTSALRGRVSGKTLVDMIDRVAQKYSPQDADRLKEAVQCVSGIFGELYSQNKKYSITMPKNQQLVTLFSQLVDRAFGKTAEPLRILAVACPRYGENDEYDILEGGLSQTASTYLQSLPLLTSAFSKSGIPFEGLLLINDTEEQMADGSLLQRLGLTVDIYRGLCRENVAATSQAVAQDSRITNLSVSLFTERFPEFIDVAANFERQLFRLAQQDERLKLALEEVANARFERHKKIMGPAADLSDSSYLTLHYAAEYMALGYLCRLYPELANNNFIVNYNSPNVEQFNNQDLLASCMKGELSPTSINTIPVFQVKYY